jgi:hypothetical protein
MQVTESTSEVTNQPFLGDELRLLDRYELQTELIETLKGCEHHRHLVPKVARCHRSYRHWRCENGHDWAEAENSCSQRICPHCARRRSLILAGRMETFVIGRTELRYVVFAEANVKDLKAGIASLWASWTRLRRSVRWLRKVKGSIVALEVTRNRDDGTWHPHLNVLIEGDYFPFEELNQLWVKATKGKGHTSHIQAANAGTVRELIKYVTKIGDLLGDAPALDEFLTAVANMRIVRTYGSFYGLSVEDEENLGVCCPDCLKNGLTRVSVVQLGYVPAHQVALDFNSVLRVARSPGVVDAELREAVAFSPAVIRFQVNGSNRNHSTLLDRWDRLAKSFAATSRQESSPCQQLQ